MPALDLILLAPHGSSLRSLLAEGAGHERAGYMLFGIADIARDPWQGVSRRRFISHTFEPVSKSDQVSESARHVTWQTDGFMSLLSQAMRAGMVPGIVHTHPAGVAAFSEQDDTNEAELARTAKLKGLPGLLSLVIAGNGDIAVRYWQSESKKTDIARILQSGPNLSLQDCSRDQPTFLDRQVRLFGEASNNMITQFRCAVVGGGATGSATLPLLMRLGIRCAAVFDRDRVEESNLNRLHGATRHDACRHLPKTELHARLVKEADLGMQLVTVDAWAGSPESHEVLKACDVIFCCSDDHAGRLFLNRFARFYGIPVIDMGLAMQRRQNGHFDLFARVTTLVPGHPCLLCGGHVSPRRAREEALKRTDPGAFEQLKAEAYLLGEGDPSPAVVSFTSEAACMAVNEWLSGITGFAGKAGMSATRVRRFHARDDRFPQFEARPNCPCCQSADTLGRGDVLPFLDMVN